MEEKIILYENKLLSITNKYEAIFNKVIKALDNAYLVFIKIWELIFFKFADLLKYTQIIMRYTTFPIHWFWIRRELKATMKENITELRLFEKGAHYIYGKPAAGKSTITYHAMMDYAYLTGRTSYTTHMMELPRKDIYGRDYFYHQLFKPSEFFKDGQQIVALDTNRFNFVVYEELLGSYHQRNNNTNDHNHEVLPLVASMGGQRHQGKGIDLFYFISQLPSNDISIMQMLKGYHIPQIKKGFDYMHWLNTGQFKTIIKGWWVESYKVFPDGRHSYKLVDKVKWFYPFKYEEDFKYFNKYNLKDLYKNKKLHKGAEMIV